MNSVSEYFHTKNRPEVQYGKHEQFLMSYPPTSTEAEASMAPNFLKKLRRKFSKRRHASLGNKVSYPAAWPLLEDTTARPPINPQSQSPLFSRLTPELRRLIYVLAIGDVYRFTHIYPDPDNPARLTHSRCTDMDSPYPTWQHTCFTSPSEPAAYNRQARRTSSTLR